MKLHTDRKRSASNPNHMTVTCGMGTRLPVPHPCRELCNGVMLVRHFLLVGRHTVLSVTQANLRGLGRRSHIRM